MDKDRKLKRYRRKDYTEVVDFPVEIVGRDGVVRHYDYDASVRLYQRRMGFAAMRFGDADLVSAELGHCRARIEQLRRSYFHLHGWTTPEGARGPEASHPELAGELAAFLGRALRAPGRLDVRFVELGREGHADVWFVEHEALPTGLILEIHVHPGAGHDEVREAALARVTTLRAHDGARGEIERLVASHALDDCTLLLTGRADAVDRLAVPRDDDLEPTPWDEIVGFVERGDLAAAWLRCRSLLDEHPWHRDAYALGAVVACHVGRPGDAEDLAFVGAATLPADPVLHATLGLVRLHQGRPVEAEAALEQALAADPELAWARTLWGLARADRARWIDVARLAGPAAGDRGKDVARLQALRRIGRRMLLAVISVAAAAAVAGTLAIEVGTQGVLVGTMLLGLALGAMAWVRRGFVGLRASVVPGHVQEALHRVHRTRSAPRDIRR